MQHSTTEMRREIPGGEVEGVCDPAFAEVAEIFVRNFAERGEVGASLTLSVEGRTVIDLWGGQAEPDAGRRWDRDTAVIVFSCTKAATALCIHLLAERGLVDLDAPVAEVWPEFAVAGKERATVRMMLDHTLGLPALRPKLKADCMLDHAYMVAHLEAEAPFWEPGTRTGYHPFTFGFLLGEVVRRVSGRSLGAFFQDEVAGPLGLDFWIGLPEEQEPRVAPIIPYRPSRDAPPSPFMAAAREPGTIPNLFFFNHGDWGAKGVNTRAGRAAEIGAVSGVTNGRGLAGLYRALTDSAAARPLGLSAGTLASFAHATSATHLDATLMTGTRFGPGFMLSMDNRRGPFDGDSFILGARAFGHVGAGGSMGFADPECGLAFGYAMNRAGPGLLLNDRGQRLVDAAYRCLGYRTDERGFWMR